MKGLGWIVPLVEILLSFTSPSCDVVVEPVVGVVVFGVMVVVVVGGGGVEVVVCPGSSLIVVEVVTEEGEVEEVAGDDGGNRTAQSLSASVRVINPHCPVSDGRRSFSLPEVFNNSNWSRLDDLRGIEMIN